MKIKLSFLLVCLVIGTTTAQITSRVMIRGKISAPIGDDVEGVVIFNRSTNKGTITNKEGVFKIKAGISDRIEVVAMQYQHFMVLVDKGVVDSKTLNIFLSETVNQLEEVVVTPYDLLGNVSVDVKKIGFSESGIGKVAEETSSKINEADYDFRPDELSQTQNRMFVEGGMIDGLNFVNLFKLVYNTKKKSTKKKHTTDIDVKIRNLYNDQFFKDYLAIEIDQINDFILFAEKNGLNSEYFESGKELDLLQFLALQSQQYRNK